MACDVLTARGVRATKLELGRFAIAFFAGTALLAAIACGACAGLGFVGAGQAFCFAVIACAICTAALGVVAMVRRRLVAIERDIRRDLAARNCEALGQLAELRVSFERQVFDPQRYWRERAQKYGRLAVGDIGKLDRIETASEREKAKLIPLLKTKLRGDEACALDFGCGCGRMTNALAELVSREVVGVDFTRELLEIAEHERTNPKVSFTRTSDRLPFPDHIFDLVWVSYVFIHIIGDQKDHFARELQRVLKPGGLLFMIEGATVWRTSSAHCDFRPLGWYQSAFPFLGEAYTHHDLRACTREDLALREPEFRASDQDLVLVMTGRKP